VHIGQFLGFAAVSLALALVPGPSWIYVISTTVSRNRRAGLIAVLGNATGITGHVLAVAVGLSAVLSYSTTIYLVVKWMGAIYLVYLGLRTMRRPSTAPPASDALEKRAQPTGSAWKILGHGILVNLLNPKVALVMLALLPQFTDTAVGHVPVQIMLIGLVHALIASIVLVILVFAAAGAVKRLREAPRLGRVFRVLAGLMLVGVGVRLALSKA
jgi:threonine/homoserine/homoserine lactone efflux protein